jgi:tetratricopeptide (TPR) repeat protein
LALVLVVAVVAAYQPVWHAGFIWDDDDHVTNNPVLRSPGGLESIWFKPASTIQYYPLVYSSFWAEYRLWKLQPLGYHLVNVLLHALNAVVLWRVLRKLEISGAWLAAAIFALHPVMVESVAWITERKNVLSCLFYLLAVLAYLRFRLLTGVRAAGTMDWRFYPLVVGLSLCALLSKTVTCSLPAVLLLLVWWKTGRVEKRDVLPLAPLFILGAALASMTMGMEQRAGAVGEEWTLSSVQRCLVAGRALWFYAGKLFWPRQLIFIYPRWEIDTRTAWQYLFPVAALAVLIALWLLRSRIGRGPLVAALCFAGTLVPALGFFDVYPFRFSYVADHFQYMACIGLISLAVGMGTAICNHAGQRGRALGALIGAIVLLILGVCTWRQAHDYQNLETLWRDTLAKNPNAWLAHNNLSIILLQEGRIEDAMGHLEQALRIKPDFPEVHYNLGVALVQLGRVQEAIAHYERAIRIKPDYAEAHNNLGIVLQQTGKIEEAIAHYEQALRSKPDYAEAHNNLGLALARLGRLQEAIGHYEQALRLKPDYAEAQYNLGVALVRLGRLPEAMGHWEQALRSKPDYAEAENDLAWLLATLAPTDGGDPVRAVTLAERACELTNNRVAAYLDTLAVTYAAAGRFNEAIATAQKAIGLARSDGQTQMLSEIETRLELYRAGRAYRAPASVTGPRGP